MNNLYVPIELCKISFCLSIFMQKFISESVLFTYISDFLPRAYYENLTQRIHAKKGATASDD